LVHEAVGSILCETHFSHFSHELYCVWHTASFGSGMKTASAGPLLAPPCAWGDCALAHASGVVAGLAQTFRPRRACDRRRMDPQRSHAPAACEPPHSGAWPLYVFSAKWSAKCYAPPHLSSARAGRQAVLTAVICFGLCASEEWGFAYILRSGSKLVSACNLTLPLVAACSCACSYAPSPRASQDNAIEYEGYERPA
jgi:hypothetical protein